MAHNSSNQKVTLLKSLGGKKRRSKIPEIRVMQSCLRKKKIKIQEDTKMLCYFFLVMVKLV